VGGGLEMVEEGMVMVGIIGRPQWARAGTRGVTIMGGAAVVIGGMGTMTGDMGGMGTMTGDMGGMVDGGLEMVGGATATEMVAGMGGNCDYCNCQYSSSSHYYYYYYYYVYWVNDNEKRLI